MALFDEVAAQVIGALGEWDFTVIPLISGVEIMVGWPYDRIDDILGESNDRTMTKPIITVVASGPHTDTFRGLGGIMSTSGAQPAAGKTRHSTRAGVLTIVSCWVDQHLGGMEMVEQLAGQIQGCVFYHRNRLPAYRHLRCKATDSSYRTDQGIWVYHLHVEGDTIVSYDE